LARAFRIPNESGYNISIVRKRGSSWNAKPQLVSATERKRCLEAILYALAIRAAYLIANSDAGNWFDTIAVNVKQHWNDPATGAPRDGLIASLQAMKSELATLQISSLEPKACFRHFKGISTPSVDQVAPIRPIFVMDTADDRVVKNRDVAEQMNEETNLAAMPWEDFEQLVRQLFEWEFGRNGVEVKVTRASRDRGVDAIMFDPDPLRGGKFVLQAKRYTRTVDVAAVRDLYGTIVNEGANRGILVTTASYGPDAYEFAKNKPISLVDGPNLIAILKRHGRAFRIDLDIGGEPRQHAHDAAPRSAHGRSHARRGGARVDIAQIRGSFGANLVQRYLVTFDLQGAQQPPGSLYTDICREIEATFGKKHFCRAFGQFCVVRSASPVGVVKNIVRGIINKKSNQFSSRDVVVFSVGRKIAISRGPINTGALGSFRRFFVE
jgi:HJR/Mrr/RecB family endonuclease